MVDSNPNNPPGPSSPDFPYKMGNFLYVQSEISKVMLYLDSTGYNHTVLNQEIRIILIYCLFAKINSSDTAQYMY